MSSAGYLMPPQKKQRLHTSVKQCEKPTTKHTGSKESDNTLQTTTTACQTSSDDNLMIDDSSSHEVTDKYGATFFLRQCRDGLLSDEREYEDIVATDNEGHSAVHYAASGGHSATIRLLVARGLDPNLKSKRLQTPLHLACLNGHVNVIHCLVEEYKVDVQTDDEDGRTPLHCLVKNLQLIDHREMFHLLARHGANLNAKDKHGRTSLYIAAEENLVEAVEYLIDLGVDVNTKDKKEVSPLVAATIKGKVNVIPTLVKAGADIDDKDRTGQTSLHAACIQGYLEVVKMLLSLDANQAAQDKDGNIPLQRACQYGHLQVAQYLVERGSDVCSLDRNGQTPLHKACKEKDSEERCQLISYLIDHGANINLQSQYARCPLHCTCEEGTPEAALVLLERGAEVSLKDKGGRTPLHYASLGGFSRIPEYNRLITILLDHCADPNDVDIDGFSAVHLAAKIGNVEAIKSLLEYHGDPNLLSKEHRSSIHYAVIGDPPNVEPNLEILRILLDAGSEVDLQDQDGFTPLHHVAKDGNMDMANILLKENANLFIHTNDQQTAEDLALHVRMKNLLLSTKQRHKYSKEGTTPLPVVKLFLTGHIQAGKTALRRHLGDTVCKCSPSFQKRKTENKERTAGIEIEYLKHDSYGTLVAHDLAGHCEYTTSHSTIIDCSNSSIFIIVFDITKEVVRIKEEVNYWSAFIKAGGDKMSAPWVLLVATHSDIAIARGRIMLDLSNIYHCVFTEWKSKYSEFFCIADGEFIVNCLEQNSAAMTHLRQIIGDCCREIRNTYPQIPTLCFELLHVLRSITDSKRPALKVTDAIEHIIKHNSKFASKESEEKGTLQELLQYLSVMGMVLLLKTGWVVVQKEELLENVFAWLFSPEGFFLNDLSDIKHGVIPIERITAVLGKDYDVTLVIDILCELLLGRMIEGKQAIQIPALLKVTQREAYWAKDEKYSTFGGWRIECQDLTDIFLPSFFPKLQIRLKNEQASRVTLWANGLIFQEDGVQALICVDDCNKILDVLVRGETGTEKQCYNLRERLKITVRHQLQESSSGTKYISKIVRPADVRDCKSLKSTYTYRLQDVLKEERAGSAIISLDGIHSDTVRELLYCNWDPAIEEIQTAPTDQQLAALASKAEIQLRWHQIGCAIGVSKTVLDRIERELEYPKGKERAALEMLHMAREKPCFNSSAELARQLYALAYSSSQTPAPSC